MQDNQAPGSFPQPSRNYEGPILDPLLVEEEFTETVGIVRRFASHNRDFSEDRLLGHLAANGVSLYGTQEDWYALFSEIRGQIVSDGNEREPPVQISWVVHRLGEKATYSMIESPVTGAPVAPQIEAADTGPPVVREAPEVERSPVPDGTQVLLDGVQSILRGTLDGMMRRNELISAVARRFGLAPTEASQLIGVAISTSRLSRVSNRGITYLTVHAGEQKEGQTGSSAGQGAEIPDERPLADAELAELDAYMKTVAYVMNSLASLRDISMGQPYDRLWRRSGLEEAMEFEDFKRYVRRMEDDGLVVIVKDAKLSTRTGRSKIIRGSKVLVADKVIRASWRVNARENLHAMYERALGTLIEEDT